jgi:transcriptional regulator with XRE-family HTH domain
MTGAELKAIRGYLKLNQHALALLLGTTRTSISRYEMDSVTYPIPETIVRAINLLLTTRRVDMGKEER